MLSAYLLSGIFVALSGIVDRCLLKRRKVEISNINRDENDGSYVRFVLNFKISNKLHNAKVKYTLRDLKNPSTVIAGKTRTLEFSSIGDNSEYLLFNKKLIKPGDWVLDVKIESSGSRLNPLYKLFPIITTIRKGFYIE